MEPIEVTTPLGAVRGSTREGLGVFLGLPYALAPDGPRRFADPEPAGPWSGIRDATRFGPAVPQLPPAPGAPSPWTIPDGLGELTLNVWSPGGEGRPVIVWLHGGRWVVGSPRMPLHDGAALARAGAVVVTVGFRIGVEGFAELPGAPSNRGLRDQVVALRWVQENIAAFGGDPGNVTVAGQSGGAASVAVLLAAADGVWSTQGLLHRAIAMSPHAGFRTPAAAAAATAHLAAALGVEPTRDAFAALPPQRLLAALPADGPSPVGPVIDGELVRAQVGDGPVRADVPLLVTFTRDEARGLAPPGADPHAVAAAFGLGPEVVEAYRAITDDVVTEILSDALHRRPARRLADAHAGGPTWCSELTWDDGLLGAAHGVDVPLLLGTHDTRAAARRLGAPPPPGAVALGDAMRAAWVRFAADGDPGWPRYDLDTRTTRTWDAVPGLADDPLGPNAARWG